MIHKTEAKTERSQTHSLTCFLSLLQTIQQLTPSPRAPMTDVLSTPELPLAFAALLQQFQSQCAHAQQVAALAGTIAESPIREDDPMLLAFAQSVQQIEEMVRAHEAAMTQEEQALQALRSETLPALRATHDKLREQQQALIDAGLEHVAPAAIAAAASASSSSARQPLATKTNNAQQSATKAPGSSTKKGAGSTKAKDSAASSSSSASSCSSTLHPDRLKLDPVSAEEFASIPAYMRAQGRLDRSKLNAGLDALRGAIREKYTLLNTPLSALSEPALTKFTAWSDADAASASDSETSGQYWVGAEDLRAVPALQALGSINLKAVLVGLRHLGRIKNSTGTGAPKYIVVQ